MNKNILIAVALLVLAGGGIWYMSQPAQYTQPTPQSQMEGMNDEKYSIIEEEIREITIDGNEFSFAPSSLELKKGEKVRLVFKNAGKMTHDFVVDELNVRTKIINGGEQEVVEFIPDQVGTFEYYCSMGKHRQLGMKGTLTVTE